MGNKEIFLGSEGDAFMRRNERKIAEREITMHPGFQAVDKTLNLIEISGDAKPRVLEIGCSTGGVLAALREKHDIEVFGVDPSEQAVKQAKDAGVDAKLGTANDLPFGDEYFDVVLFGFCLYVCDRNDLFAIAAEADRVLKPNAWLAIYDFFSPSSLTRSYAHSDGVEVHKSDFKQMFLWHPFYECWGHELHSLEASKHTDDPNQWGCVSILRRFEGSD